MIQRIQTIYLLAAGIAALLFSFVNEYALQYAGSSGILNVSPSILVQLSALMALVSIFLFKNRSNQIKLIWLSIILAIAGLGLYIYVDGIQNFYLDWQFYIAFSVIVFLYLAKRGVQKDEELIRSADRLR